MVDEKEELLGMLVLESDFLEVFLKALKFAAIWGGPMRDLMFECLAKLCHHENFYEEIAALGGVPVLVHEIDRRKKLRRQDRRTGASRTNDDEKEKEKEGASDEIFTEKLLIDFRRDWAASRIQAIVRSKRVRKLVGRKLFVLGVEVNGLIELQGDQNISYDVAAMLGR
eukprot:CAMPEP_0182421580 /NCGR_PEP_ID=MMETSP1167-20130531/6986_1 /TAXON_ID=2988 /ORGANISM="Mallomonas Sp, Strain CCMP3275" /LENGTH=168 /DNA_ID=CAMNT_0024598831 /DNA_START=694 /DNA_END=1197 /DNA_ORIENTATION=+